MLREWQKTIAAEVLFRTGVVSAVAGTAAHRQAPLVLAYHRVVRDYRDAASRTLPAMLVSTRTLEKHLDWIGRRYRFASVAELPDVLTAGRRGGRPPAFVTFDDGYRDVYENALPLLSRKGIPGAVFVVTDLVGTARALPHDALFTLVGRALRVWRRPQEALSRILTSTGLAAGAALRLVDRAEDACLLTPRLIASLHDARLARLRGALASHFGSDGAALPDQQSMTWPMLEDLLAAGWTIGSHTARHMLLTHGDPVVVHRELVVSRKVLERRLGRSVPTLAYPGGWHDGSVLEAAERAGYRLAFTTCLHADRRRPLLSVPRRVFWERTALDARGRFSEAMMACQVHGLFRRWADCPHRLRAA